jgi:hypothetical protein
VSIRVAYRVQSTPGRDGPRTRLLRGLPLATQVVIDDGEPPANPWRGYQKCLSNLPNCTHLVIIQDDALVCDDFPLTVEQVIKARPEQPICLFLHGGDFLRTLTAARQARQAGKRFVSLYFRDLMPVVAVVWPRQHAEHFLEWSKTATLPGMPRPVRSDDACAGLWMRESRVPVLATLPSLVEHPDDVISTIGKRHAHGQDKGRTAWWYDPQALEYDWAS